jgi:hypothetical protein
MSNDCGCSVRLIVHNECATPIAAQNFEFESCRSMGVPARANCTSLAPKTQGHFEMLLGNIGLHQRAFTLLREGRAHALRVEVDVSSIDDGEMCSVGRVPGRRRTFGFIALVVGCFIALVARRDGPTRDGVLG